MFKVVYLKKTLLLNTVIKTSKNLAIYQNLSLVVNPLSFYYHAPCVCVSPTSLANFKKFFLS